MKNLKKFLVAIMFVLLVGSLTACSQMNKITGYFEDQGYVRYRYNNSGGSVLFSVHDQLITELGIVVDVTTTAATTSTSTATTTTGAATQLRFISYVFSNDTYAVIVMEFDSAEYMQELLDTSSVLAAVFDGQNSEDYVNGNCLLIVLDDYMSNYDNFVEIFQGRAEPLVTTATE